LGIVVRHDRIVAAKVQFPLAEEGSSDQALGSRHRAALGLSEETDAVVLVVSEETGQLSVAVDGEISSNVKIDQLRAKLRDLLSEVDSE
ncbi:MAG: DNA integrity scanning protein DisA nucleotide-binding domain protein, partial [Planctomycetota bacterium]|nr:DNA integrity scanning protein DisA nucleotide-binding domain protein [Planctomycetota bacterium]